MGQGVTVKAQFNPSNIAYATQKLKTGMEITILCKLQLTKTHTKRTRNTLTEHCTLQYGLCTYKREKQRYRTICMLGKYPH